MFSDKVGMENTPNFRTKIGVFLKGNSYFSHKSFSYSDTGSYVHMLFSLPILYHGLQRYTIAML